MSKIGLSISMHNEIRETLRAIKSFQKFHPESEIRIWGNEPEDLKTVGQYLDLPTKNSPQYVNKLMGVLHSPGNNDGEKGAEILREFLYCALEVYNGMKCEYVVYLHPDHLVVGQFSDKLLKNDLEIHKVNRYTKSQQLAWLSVTGKPLALRSYGLAGYFRRESLISALEFLLDDDKVKLDELLGLDINFIFEDLIIPCAFDYLGYSVVDQNLTTEIRRRKRVRSFIVKPILIHQMSKISNDPYP